MFQIELWNDLFQKPPKWDIQDPCKNFQPETKRDQDSKWNLEEKSIKFLIVQKICFKTAKNKFQLSLFGDDLFLLFGCVRKRMGCF